ncbi:YvrJ family protein [Alkalihalophilus marmarensis]|jgi:hypothetical protein|uniref:YvrJ family protein n=1 Tax=Alkalihalophilus marmarensis TaxID=521377 RepID=UPI00040A20C8|nr:YvrJ family protein [Alkalihalophilus marmarensis]MCM3488524.1 YvrJ family protein [Alkalihalophilus marmarensis]
MTSFELWLPILSEYGFPVMVTFYLLYRLEKKLDLMIEVLHQLKADSTKKPPNLFTKQHY